jgi:uncharacterized protein YjbI with pentapeptide repeats
MTLEEFKRILTTFADNPDSLDITKGELLIQILDEVIEAQVYQREGTLIVSENGVDTSAQQWLIKRIAHLPQLADRILNYVSEEPTFVTPSGELLDQLEQSASDEREHLADTVQSIIKTLGRRPAGTSSVLYLTSDAGEGKTTLINQVAHIQAEAYKKKETDWLLIPITLGGRPFLRFDDIIVGALVNRLRFPFFYYDSFLELVRMGVLVPAFDGFEEMFIESSSGEALSALGNLLQNLESSGTILISARKAYFEYKSFANQAKLFDAIKSDSAAFSSLAINRWSHDQFIKYCDKRGISDGETIYSEVSSRFGQNHPLLTRAVLVKRLLDVARDIKERESLLDKLGQAPHNYFFQFVNAIIEREATEKWIDRSGQLAKPLITVPEHHDLLSFIAQEMWLINSDAIKDDALDLIADIFSEIHGKSPLISRQIKERIKQHALLTSINSNKSMFAFDHEEFKNFFLGQAIGRRIYEDSRSDLKSILRSGPLLAQCYDAAIQFLKHNYYDLTNAAKTLQVISQADIISSFTRENCGGLIIRILDEGSWNNLTISNVTFPQNSLLAKSISGVNFTSCYFQPTMMDDTTFNNCNFENCRFDRLELHQNMDVSNTAFSKCEINSLVPRENDNRIFDPRTIERLLSKSGFTVQFALTELSGVVNQQTDEEMQVLDRVIRCFLRSTTISENVLRLKLGAKANFFFKDILPSLTKFGIMIEADARSDSKQAYYRLNVQMREIDEAITHSNGNFEVFLSRLASA